MNIVFRKYINNLAFSIAFFLIAILYFSYQQSKINIDNLHHSLQKEIISKEKDVDNYLKSLVDFYKIQNSWNGLQNKFPIDLFHDEGLAFFIYSTDSLIFWSDNSIPVSAADFNSESGIIKKKNAWYRIFLQKFDKYTIVCYSLIKNAYAYQNDYLKNDFFKDFHLPSEIEITNEKDKFQITDIKSRFLFSIQLNTSLQISEKSVYFILLFFILGFIFFSSFLYNRYEKMVFLKSYSLIRFLIYFFIIFLLRSLSFYFEFPGLLYDTKLFSPYYYAASEFLPSLGDLLINSCILFHLSYLFFTKVKLETLLSRPDKIKKYFLSVLSIFTIIVLFYYYVVICKSVIYDSSIRMLMNDIFELNFESFVGTFVIFALSASFILISTKLFYLSIRLVNNVFIIIFVFLTAIIIFLLFPFHIFWKEGFFYPIFLIIYFIILYLFHYFEKKLSIIQRILILILFFSFFSTFTFYKYNDNKELEKRKLLVQKLSAENDPIAEYLFKDIMLKIKSDSVIHRQISNYYPEDSIITHIKSKYFKGYLSKYQQQITLCKDFQNLIINSANNINVNCDKFFYDKITLNGYPTQTENFYSLDFGSGSNSYIAVIRFFDDISDSLLRTSVYIELDAKFISKDLGYPELLIDKKLNLVRDLNDYSYAKYVNKQLVKRYGKCFYDNKLTYYVDNSGFNFFIKDDYNHILYNVNNRIDFILSKQNVGFLERLSPFSNFFIAFTLFLCILIFATPYFRKAFSLSFNFKTRLQISVLSIILISFVLIAITTFIYIARLSTEKNSELLTEKTHSVLIELENKLGNEINLDNQISASINDLLVKLSNVFFTDINLYNTEGELIASSRLQIFDEGLISDLMNSKALYELKNKGKTQFVNNEKIGSNEYLSSYMPFVNNDNKIIAYLNLPYFAKQGDLKREISSFLKAYLNIFLFLVIIAIVVALFVSNYITSPLRMIINSLSKIKLGKKNEKIQWQRNDEIGKLIIEYNSMIDQLAISAEKLAKSEREVAWREMAKQVAHEIKNPLTPMKLSIQHLQRAWNDKVPDWDERLNRLSNTIIEQIDSLSVIASDFSNFAKTDDIKLERVNISDIIRKTVDLYVSNDSEHIDFKINIIDNCIIKADKTQLFRIFNNLIKNAVQALSEINSGVIEISISSENSSYVIQIKDNGIGIDKQMQHKIFSPYFTTKSGGSGLGLAMVKSMIEACNGKIWFESELNSGTIFYIEFQKDQN